VHVRHGLLFGLKRAGENQWSVGGVPRPLNEVISYNLAHTTDKNNLNELLANYGYG
jgi:hypothetical protein